MHKKTFRAPVVTENDYDPWPDFRYTGNLRAHRRTPRRAVPAHISRPDYAEDGNPRSEREMRGFTQIKVLEADEIAAMRDVCQLAREVLDEAARAIRVDVTADEIDRVVHEATIARDCYPSPLNYCGYPKSCCTSVNEIICHGIPDVRPLEDGDIVNVDVTCFKDGFHGDLNETFFVGRVDEGSCRLVEVAHECLRLGIDLVKPGERYRDIGNVIQKHAQSNGCSVVRTYCGHGIHRLFHTAPNVPHYAKNKAIGVMKPGHCFTIEPMISAGSWKDVTWPDDWTSATIDGKRSAQFEETLLVTKIGCEVLTRRRDHNGKPYFMTQ